MGRGSAGHSGLAHRLFSSSLRSSQRFPASRERSASGLTSAALPWSASLDIYEGRLIRDDTVMLIFPEDHTGFALGVGAGPNDAQSGTVGTWTLIPGDTFH